MSAAATTHRLGRRRGLASRAVVRTRTPVGTTEARSLPSVMAWRLGQPEGSTQMAGRVEGKVAFITGAARGQGRSHAIRLAQEGADIIAVDLAAQVDSVPYPMATPEDLAQTVKEVEALDRRIVATQADVRDYAALKKALDQGVA